jgi:hypothetical protein
MTGEGFKPFLGKFVYAAGVIFLMMQKKKDRKHHDHRKSFRQL